MLHLLSNQQAEPILNPYIGTGVQLVINRPNKIKMSYRFIILLHYCVFRISYFGHA